MEFSTSTKDQVVVYQLEGNLIGETDGINITESLSEFLDKGDKNFVIDLEGLQHINSSGLGVLITLLILSIFFIIWILILPLLFFFLRTNIM